MSRRSAQSLAKSKVHSETPSQKLAKAKTPQPVDAGSKAKGGTQLTHGGRTDSVPIGGTADEMIAALEAAAAKSTAIEAFANAKRLEKVAKDLLKKASPPGPPTIPSRTVPKHPNSDVTTGATRKRKPIASDKIEKASKRNPGPFFDASLANPPPPKLAAVGESLNKGYPPCAFTLISEFILIPFCVGGPW